MIAKEAILEAEQIIENACAIERDLYQIVAYLVETPLSTVEIIQETHVPAGWAWVSYTPYVGEDPVILVPTTYYGPTFTEHYGRFIKHMIDYRYTSRPWFIEAIHLLEAFEKLCQTENYPFDLDLLLSKLRQWIARPFLPDSVARAKQAQKHRRNK